MTWNGNASGTTRSPTWAATAFGAAPPWAGQPVPGTPAPIQAKVSSKSTQA